MHHQIHQQYLSKSIRLFFCLALATTALILTWATVAYANGPGMVNSFQKISATEGGFTGILNNGDQFGFFFWLHPSSV